jgi:Ser-tRNA(Ala) deacylase AlaX
MTEALYLDDSYLKECDAAVESVNGKEVVLDRTIFYPRGGGQPADRGKIMVVSGSGQPVSGSEFRVVNVLKKEGRIVHELDREPKHETGYWELKAGDRVLCVLDWEWRYKLMRMHTAAHVLGATMFNELGVLITGNQLEEDKARFDFSLAEFDRARFEDVVKKANGVLASGAELRTYSLPREEALRIPGVVKLAGALPPSITTLRIVEIRDIDIQADGGTHVRNLKEVGKIEILKLENKGKDNRRIYFTLSR